MPAAASTRYFDLGAIQPLLEAGGTVLTPNLRLARRIKHLRNGCAQKKQQQRCNTDINQYKQKCGIQRTAYTRV